ncbi:MAG TPA: hypothetical protein DET40_14045 [Lentisphaeria bacterium]|nr:MAG: hypothetical protein A2X45_00800 [Lentisphaerae bacterium GWF2_50_93]HCE44660.1 hypothetical protein [Lentisphaeria bacterium]
MPGGCTSDFTEIRKSELSQAFILNSSPTFQGYHYLGSDESFHYFSSKWKYGQDMRFKINKNDMVVLKEEPYGRREIRIYEFKPKENGVELFWKAGNIDLYRKINSD